MLTIFDIDGTLTETFTVDEECFVESLDTVLGISNVDTDWDRYAHVTDSGLAEELSMIHRGVSISKVEVEALEQHFVSLLKKQELQNFGQIRGAATFIAELRAAGMNQIAYATGGWRRSAELKLKSAGVFYDDIPLFSASDAISREEIMLLAADAVGRNEMSQVCYFGDGSWDVKASKNLGWNLIGIGSRIENLRELGVNDVFSDYSEPKKILGVLKRFESATA